MNSALLTEALKKKRPERLASRMIKMDKSQA
jgi:hypothetical protein